MVSLKRNFLYNICYQMLLIIIPLVTSPYISRTLGAEKIGFYSYSYSIAQYFVLFALLGLQAYGNRLIAEVRDNREKLSKTFSELYSLQLITSSFFCIVFVVYTVLSQNLINWIMLIYVISTFFDLNWLFFGLENFRITVVRNAVIKIITALLIFLLVKNENDIYLYSIIMTGGMLASQVVLWLYKPSYISFRFVGVKRVLPHIKPVLVLFIPLIASSLYKYLSKIVLGNMTTLEQVGFYECTERIVNIPIVFINALGTVLMPRISNLVAKGDNTSIDLYFDKSIAVSMFLSTSISFGIMSLADVFVPWYYGSDFKECILLFKIMMPSVIFTAIASVIRNQYLIPYKQDVVYVKSISLGAIVNVILNLFLIPRMGARGAAIGILVAELFVCFYQIAKVRQVFSVKKILKNSSPFFVSGSLMYILLSILSINVKNSLVEMFIRFVIGAIVYMLLIILLHGKKVYWYVKTGISRKQK